MSRVFFLPPDVVKRANPVCHFVTPLDGNMELDINRTTEVKLEELSCYIVHKKCIVYKATTVYCLSNTHLLHC